VNGVGSVLALASCRSLQRIDRAPPCQLPNALLSLNHVRVLCFPGAWVLNSNDCFCAAWWMDGRMDSLEGARAEQVKLDIHCRTLQIASASGPIY
jgi:hypothetical protein